MRNIKGWPFLSVGLASLLVVTVAGSSQAAPLPSQAALKQAMPVHTTDVRWRGGWRGSGWGPGIGLGIAAGALTAAAIASGPAWGGYGYYPEYSYGYAPGFAYAPSYSYEPAYSYAPAYAYVDEPYYGTYAVPRVRYVTRSGGPGVRHVGRSGPRYAYRAGPRSRSVFVGGSRSHRQFIGGTRARGVGVVSQRGGTRVAGRTHR